MLKRHNNFCAHYQVCLQIMTKSQSIKEKEERNAVHCVYIRRRNCSTTSLSDRPFNISVLFWQRHKRKW